MPIDFSIIVPSYGRPRQLGTCLEALAAQDFPRDQYEVVVVDDGGNPPLAPVVAPFSESIAISCIQQVNGGPALARNTGARAATGRFLAFTDDDCAPEPGWLSALHSVLKHNPEVMAGGLTVNELADNACSATSQLIQDLAYEYYATAPGRSPFFASNNLALAAPTYQAIGGFDSAFRTAEDRDFCDRWTISGKKMLYVPGAVVRHAHDLTPRSFWAQHVSYGRGARRYYLAHRRRDPKTATIDTAFHFGIFAKLPKLLKGRTKASRVACLLMLWQLANATGFVLETLRPARGGKKT